MIPNRRLRPLTLWLPLAGALFSTTLLTPRASAEDRLGGEVAELTDKTRADAQKEVDVIVKASGDVVKARRALLKMGPVIWPVVDNALRLTPPDTARPHLNYLKALLAKKTEPDFEYFRGRIRRRVLIDDLPGIQAEAATFRNGRPDPANPKRTIPPTVRGTTTAGVTVYRSEDGTLAVAFGRDGDAKKPDAPEVSLTDPAAGFAMAIGGKPQAYERRSGKGSCATVEAPLGFAFAWATDGAPGKAPGGDGGDAGSAQAKGGAGEFTRSGSGGSGAPGGK